MQDWCGCSLSETAAEPRNPDLDAGTLDPGNLPELHIGELSATRTRDFQAVILQSVLDEIHEHGDSSLHAEVCGVLVGNVFRDSHGPFLHISASIRGDSAEGHAAQVTFKAETWSHIQSVMESKHPDERIVGWYHTHPGFGIFLSGMDHFIQDNFFNLPWQVAFVYDPKGGDEGMFVWRKGTSQREPFLVQAPRLIAAPSGEPVVPRIDSSPIPWRLAFVGFAISFVMTCALLWLLPSGTTGTTAGGASSTQQARP